MKFRNIFLAISALTAISAGAQPKLHWMETVHNFGAFSEDVGSVGCEFRAVNTGTEPVTVLNARANCGCTRPAYPRTPIQPGDTLRVSVAYDATGRPGRFAKEVKIETTAGSATCLIKGTVIGSPTTLASRYPVKVGDVCISNAVTPFGMATKGRVLAAAVNIYNSTDHDIRPAVDSLPKYVNALFRPEVIKVGEQGTLSLTAYTASCPDYGVLTDSFVLIPDSENSPADRAAISTTVIVNEDFSKMTVEQKKNAAHATLGTDMVEFGRLTPGKEKKTLTFTITNTGHQPLMIRRLYTPDPALTLKINHEKVDPGKEATVKVTVDCSELHSGQPLNARITLITNTPDAPSQIVRVTGEVY